MAVIRPIEVNKLCVISSVMMPATGYRDRINENAVRAAIMQPKLADAQQTFMAKPRQDSYIKISDEYRPLVAPLLFEEERSEKVSKN